MMGAGKRGKDMIDWARVENLREEIGADDFEQVVAMFLEEADDAIIRLRGAHDAKALESDLHFLKGSALNLGFSELAQICQLGERMASAGETGLRIEDVAQVYQTSRQAFLGRIDGSVAA